MRRTNLRSTGSSKNGAVRGTTIPRTNSIEARPAPTYSASIPHRQRLAAHCTLVTYSATPTPTPSPATNAWLQRMAGREVFYPMGWDDNGLPTERRVQNYYGVIKPGKRSIPISRPNFVELCLELTTEDEKAFEHLWRTLGLSVDWGMTYATINPVSQRTSQAYFLRDLARGDAYQQEAPTIWDVSFQTAVAQAEIEDKELPAAYHRIPFARADGNGPAVEIETTRPELLPACVALVAHPDDERYQPLFGQKVITPLFGVEIEVRAHHLAQPDKGSGIAMICTFGDTTDVTWWRELDLGVRSVIDRRGRFREIEWGSPGWESTDLATATENYEELQGKNVRQAQARTVELLQEQDILVGEPRPIEHMVKFFEKGDRPLEIVTSRQWYIRNGGRDPKLRDDLVARGTELTWHPTYMKQRYESWVGGLNGDWLISRQRFFGVPIPVWYGLDDTGEIDYETRHVPDESLLPIDPSTDVPAGFDESQRGQPGGFTGDPDIMDTWATSSLTPQIVGRELDDPDLFARIFPMDMRPQGHDIIRTWLFATVVRSHHEQEVVPWKNANLSGWVLDPDRKKMSKSKGNVVTPLPLLERFGADAVRYWAVNGRPGTDTAVDEAQMKVGRRLAIKLLNVSKFVLGLAGDDAFAGEVTEPLDKAVLASLAEVVDVCTTSFENFDYARAIERTEGFFWPFCDNYVELVKGRAYGSGSDDAVASARRTLVEALSILQRLFAPHLAFVTEEVWSWWQDGSVHQADWPTTDNLRILAANGNPAVFEVAAEILGEIRRAKTEAKVSLRTDVEAATIHDTRDRLSLIELATSDLKDAGRISDLQLTEATDSRVEVSLAE